jgi:hypothetical protein
MSIDDDWEDDEQWDQPPEIGPETARPKRATGPGPGPGRAAGQNPLQKLKYAIYGLIIIVILLFVFTYHTSSKSSVPSAHCHAPTLSAQATISSQTKGALSGWSLVAEPHPPSTTNGRQFRHMAWVSAKRGESVLTWAVADSLAHGGAGTSGAIVAVNKAAKQYSSFAVNINPQALGLSADNAYHKSQACAGQTAPLK